MPEPNNNARSTVLNFAGIILAAGISAVGARFIAIGDTQAVVRTEMRYQSERLIQLEKRVDRIEADIYPFRGDFERHDQDAKILIIPARHGRA